MTSLTPAVVGTYEVVLLSTLAISGLGPIVAVLLWVRRQRKNERIPPRG